MAIDHDVLSTIEENINRSPAVLFMKGSREEPRCGFSARAVTLLEMIVDDFETVDVLQDDDLREGLKEYSDWPTIPQLYVDGDFVGGCDIIENLFVSGGLAELLGQTTPEAAQPKITVTEAAIRQFEEAASGSSNQVIRVMVTSKNRCELAVGEPRPGDVRVRARQTTMVLDPFSAGRADGMQIGFVRRGFQSGFEIDVPAQTPAGGE